MTASPTPSPPASPAPSPRRRNVFVGVAAAFAGWLLPGLGHLLSGHTTRGLVLAITLSTMWLGGLLIGGLSVVDRHVDPAWFLGQALLAPSLAADHYRASHVKAHSGGMVPADNPPFE
ncbi:MAG: DUF6677 family protein, partial [Algisphaera sp.]